MKGLWLNLIPLLALSVFSACNQSTSSSSSENSSSDNKCISSTTSGSGVITTRIAGSTSAPYGFVEYLPPGYASNSNSYPLIVFLHGLGEQGTDNATNLESKMSAHGPIKRIKQGRQFPALVFAPQSSVWWSAATLKTFFQYIQANYRVDASRIYVTGLSMGGGGTWDYMRFDSSRIAAGIAISGASAANNGVTERNALSSVPHISIHNIDDGTVTYRNSEGFGNSLGAKLTSRNQVLDNYVSGSNVTMHFSPQGSQWDKISGSLKIKDVDGSYSSSFIYGFDATGGHDAWTKTYASEDIWNWLFCQRK